MNDRFRRCDVNRRRWLDVKLTPDHAGVSMVCGTCGMRVTAPVNSYLKWEYCPRCGMKKIWEEKG